MPRQTELSFEEIVNRLDTGLTRVEGCGCGGIGLLVNELGEIAQEGNERAEAKLIELLKHDNLDVRFPAAGYLGLIESEKALKPLEELLKTEKEPVVKETVERSIALIRTAIAEKN